MTVFYHFDLITGGLYFRQDMGRKHNCPFSSDLLNQVSDLYDLHRIEPVSRFVQYHKARIMNDCLCNSHPLLITPGQISDQPLFKMCNAAFRFGRIYCLPDFPGVHQPQTGTISQVFING